MPLQSHSENRGILFFLKEQLKWPLKFHLRTFDFSVIFILIYNNFNPSGKKSGKHKYGFHFASEKDRAWSAALW